MEEDFLRDHPELRPFVLSDVQLTGTTIGGGAYGQVEEVAFPVEAAAKTIHAILQGGPNERAVQGRGRVRERVPTDEHRTPPERRPVSGGRLLPRLATARPRHGATADESSRLARSRHAAPARLRLAASLLLSSSSSLSQSVEPSPVIHCLTRMSMKKQDWLWVALNYSDAVGTWQV